MKKEYVAHYQHKKDAGTDVWMNAVWYITSKRTASSKEAAENCLKRVLEIFNKGERFETDKIGSIGIRTHIDSATADSLSIVATRILCREVTEWEEC